MKSHIYPQWILKCLMISGLLLLSASARASLTVTVVDDAGKPIPNFRWLLEEDNTALTTPNIPTNNTVGINVHKSHARVLGSGTSSNNVNGTWQIKLPKATLPKTVPDGTVLAGVDPLPTLTSANYSDPDPNGRYVLSVMASGYSVGGQTVYAGQSTVRIVMNSQPLPTSQISILVFHDHLPINNEPDAEEEGLGGFRIAITDILGGPMTQDAFGYPLGTTYKTNNLGNYYIDTNTGRYAVDKMGDGFVYTDKDGKALIKNMWNGKFSIQAIPPTGENWNGGHATLKSDGYMWQTATIEGTPVVDTWAPANGAKVFLEGWGAGFYHAFFGFVDPGKLPGAKPAPGAGTGVTIKGRLLNSHFGRPPQTALMAPGAPVTDGWVGLNAIDATGASSRGLEVQPCDADSGEFEITNVAPGTSYELVSWDRPLDAIFNFITISVPANPPGGVFDVGDVYMYRWFGWLQGSVFADLNHNGFRDPGEETIPSVPVNVRYRNGMMIYQTKTKVDGTYAFTEVFPFFKWLVAEVDNRRWNATGITAVTDDGGIIPTPNLWTMPSADINRPDIGVRNPQVQYQLNADGSVMTLADGVTPDPSKVIVNPNTGNALSRTQTSEKPSEPVLTQAIQLYHGQNSQIDWGKAPWGAGQNGGISGIVSYNNTRAEADPRYGVMELWDAGVPRVQVAAYQFETNYAALAAAHNPANGPTVNGEPADINLWKIKILRPGATKPRLADVDNYPFGWASGGTRGPEDIDRDDLTHSLPDAGRVFNPGDAIQITYTDSWDDDVYKNADPAHLDANGWPAGTTQINPPIVQNRKVIGSDGFATWNQIRPGVFDGAYVINSYHPGGIASGSPETDFLPPGDYIVQATPPPGYLIQTEESRNIVTGDPYTPSKLDLPAELVGDFHLVPPVLSLFPDQKFPADFANQWRPLADRKLVTLEDGRNFVCDFNLYTEVPKATRVVGFSLNDLSAEFDPTNPSYGEKEGPGWIPVSFRDWAGHEVARVYADEYGCYNAMMPSTYNADVPCASGYAPQILTLILNDPTMPDPANPTGPRIPDPNYNPNFTTGPVSLDYFPAGVNYADTPILPVGAFVGSPNATLDVEAPDGTPVISNIVGTQVGGYGGAWVQNNTDTITITSAGIATVLDPNYRLHGTPSKVLRDFSFGATQGAVTLDGVAIPAASVTWTASTISFKLPSSFTTGNSGTRTSTGGREWQLMITRGDTGKTTPIGLTFSYETNASRVHVVVPVDTAATGAGVYPTHIQDAIDASQNGDLVIVPYSPYIWNEYAIMWKPIRLQGSGFATVLNGAPDPGIRVATWHDKVETLLGEDPFLANECPGVQVLGQTNSTPAAATATPVDSGFSRTASRIDGFNIKSAIHGGGIQAYNRATNLRISNNRISGCRGEYAGGISIGMQDPVGATYDNTGVLIERNQIFKNSSGNGAGAIGIYTGANGYKIRNNYLMGNFATSDPGGVPGATGYGAGGGGVAHVGLSPGGLIANNVIAFNEVFFGYSSGGGDGAGIFIAGEADGTDGLGSTGSGSVTIINNLIQGNLAAAGYGGGIRLAGINGPDVAAAPNNKNQWYQIDIYNNIIVNNAAGMSGGGISLQDAVNVRIINNTIADNDATATAHIAFNNPADPTVSVPQGAGIVSHPNSAALTGVSPLITKAFSDPLLENNIIWHNRSFHFDFKLVGGGLPLPPSDLNVVPHANSKGILPDPTAAGFVPNYVDVAVVGGGSLTLQNSITSTSGATPTFVQAYVNTFYTAVIPDEGGNNISLRIDPISLYTPSVYSQVGGGTARGDYHLGASLAYGANVLAIAGLATDIDGQNRSTPVDVGADQFAGAVGTIVPPPAPSNLSVAIVGPVADTTIVPGGLALEATPNVPPGPQVGPPPNNPVWLTTDPGTASLPLLVAADIQSLNSLAFRLKIQATPADSLAAQADPVATYLFSNFAQSTKDLLAAYAGGADDAVLAALLTELNAVVTSSTSLYAQVNGQLGYTPSARTLTLVAATPSAFNSALLNRSVLQDAFTEVRRWYDPQIAYVHLVCGDGFAVMADGTELYIFGFSDQTAVANNPGNDPTLGPDKVFTAALANANLSAPTIVVNQDQDFHLDLSNVGFAFRPDLFDPHTVHFHGFPQAAPIFDGMPLASVSVHEGATLPYYYKLQVEGTYFYHCHVEATEHMQQGMIGNLWVESRQTFTGSPIKGGTPVVPIGRLGGNTDPSAPLGYAYNDGDGSTAFDVEYPMQITGFDHYFHEQEIAIQPPAFATMYDTYPLLNGRGYPDTVKATPIVNSLGNAVQQVSSLVTAKKGQKILLRVSNVSETEFDTLTVPGIPMKVIAKDARLLRGPDGKNLYYRTTSVTLGGGETADVILDTTNTLPGTYFIYNARLNQLSNDQEDYGGLMTHIVITP
jgi:hypothetical protein